MPKKLAIEQIKDFITEFDVNKDCELLSLTYKNLKTPLKFRCNLCGKIFYRDFGHLKQRKKFKCQDCVKKEHKSNLSIEDIRKFILENDKDKLCSLVSNEYINNTTPLKLKCNKCGTIFERDYQHLSRNGGRFQCPKCGILQGAKAKKYSIDFVKQKILERGYTLIGDYIDAHTPFEVECERHHKTTLIFSYFLIGHSGCKECANIENSGENHYNWKGGESEVIESFRKSIKEWKHLVLKRDGFKCVLTNSNKDLVIHHLKSFNTIVKESSEITGIPVLRKVSDYENINDFYTLRDEVINSHSIILGITLNREVHNLFHSIYGKGNNTIEQFNEFQSCYQNNEKGDD